MLAALALAVLWASIPTAHELATRVPASTAFIDLRRAQAQQTGRPFALKWQWRRLDQISQYLRAAVVYAEDARFFEHHGVDWSAIEQAAQSNYKSGAMAIGGSTITQQLAKNLYLSPSRSLIRKAREVLIAGRLEEAMGKQRILELYLNVVEWGDGIFGAEAAARHWYGRSARQLTPVQAARLAAALPNPFKRTPKTRTAALQRKVGRILWHMRRDGLINRAQLEDAAREAGLPAPPSELPAQLPPELEDRGDEGDGDTEEPATPPAKGDVPESQRAPADQPNGEPLQREPANDPQREPASDPQREAPAAEAPPRLDANDSPVTSPQR